MSKDRKEVRRGAGNIDVGQSWHTPKGTAEAREGDNWAHRRPQFSMRGGQGLRKKSPVLQEHLRTHQHSLT